MAEITFDDVTKRYADGTEAVKHFDLDIKDGEFMIFVGPSGCGKSTALRMIAGLEDISEGTLRIGGDVVNDRAPRDRDIAMVFQNYALYPHMTVRDNMGFALKLRHAEKAEIDRKVREAAEILDLTEHLDRKPANLSGGQRQRVAMGRAIVRDPKAFLMDEPLSNLDAKLRVQMRTSVAKLQNQLRTTMVYVTHDQVEAMTLGDRVAVMRSGVIQQVDTPRELYEHPTNLFVAGFIGSPAMNFLPGELGPGEVRTSLGTIPLSDETRRKLDESGGPRSVTVGIRPEHFQDAAFVHEQRDKGIGFRAVIDVLEPMGSEANVYFRSDADQRTPTGGLDAAEGRDDVGASGQVVARLDAETGAVEGQPLELWFDARRVHLFDPRSGRSLLG